MNKKLKNDGITLISLVITIIIMLILVGVSINLAVNGGLFKYAGNAVGDTKNAMKQEQELINNIIDKHIKPNVPSEDDTGSAMKNYDKTEKDATTGVLKANATYESGEYTAVIPKGFKIIPGLNGTTTIADGLVIQDAEGNEFVWIPVKVVKEGENADSETRIASFYRSNWSSSGRGTTKYTATSGSSYNEPLTSGGYADEKTDYNDMLKSVYTYEGFYIGRYEAGSETARTDKANETTKMVVQRDKYPYNYVGWGTEMTDYTSEITYNGKNQGLGALALSKRMYPTKEMCDGDTSLTYKDVGVTSTLCYGVMWDAMLEFISTEKNVVNSTTWGNYSDNTGDDWKITRTKASYSIDVGVTWEQVGNKAKEKTSKSEILLTTGANDNFSAKNIFDVAGNVKERTNEAESNKRRITRGDSFGNSISNMGGAKNRYTYDSVNLCHYYIGFRPALYITNK